MPIRSEGTHDRNVSPMDNTEGSPIQLGRRDFMYVGLVGGLGLTLGDFLRLEAQASETTRNPVAKARSLIHIFLKGGFAHQDSFDPKPQAPPEYRGELGTVATRINGVRFSEHLSRTAQVADKLTVIRTMTHTEAEHTRGEHNMFTGYRPSPALVYPSMGSVVSQQLGARNNLPPYICLPNQTSLYAGSGFLSTSYGPFALGADPGRPGFRVRDLALPTNTDQARFSRRRRMLSAVDDHFRSREQSDSLDAMDSFYQRAYAMLSSRQAREAFNIRAESTETRQRYGLNRAGARMLLCRRLIEAGVRFVSMSYGRWDSHTFHYRAIGYQMPRFDQALAALINDLQARRLLDHTLVVVSTEFGRTPRINTSAGRDHWPRVFSIALAGGGVKRGHVYGASDATASEVAQNPMSVENLTATIYHLLGINPNHELQAPGNRPIPIVRQGQVVRDILA